MSSKLRYYKDEHCKFYLMHLLDTDSGRFISVGGDNYDTLKDVVKSICEDKHLIEYINKLNIKYRTVIRMYRQENYSTPQEYMDRRINDDKDNILHYCDEAFFYFTTNMKLEKAEFIFTNMYHYPEFSKAEYYAEDGSVRIGTGALDALEFFDEECDNRILADFLISKHFDFDVKY